MDHSNDLKRDRFFMRASLRPAPAPLRRGLDCCTPASGVGDWSLCRRHWRRYKGDSAGYYCKQTKPHSIANDFCFMVIPPLHLLCILYYQILRRMSLPEQNHLSDQCCCTCLQPVEVHTTGEIRRCEIHRKGPGSLITIHQHCHLLSENVVHRQAHLR